MAKDKDLTYIAPIYVSAYSRFLSLTICSPYIVVLCKSLQLLHERALVDDGWGGAFKLCPRAPSVGVSPNVALYKNASVARNWVIYV